jgi:hypothetical protein
MTPPSSTRRDTIFSNLFTPVAVLLIIVLFLLDRSVGEQRWVIAFVFALIIVGLGCYLNYKFGERASKHLDNPFVRGLSELVVSFAVSAICVIFGFLFLVFIHS